MTPRLTLWDSRSQDVRAWLAAHDPALVAFLERCPHGQRVRVPGVGENLAARDRKIRGWFYRQRAKGRDRVWCLEVLSARHGLTFKHVERIVYRGSRINGPDMRET